VQTWQFIIQGKQKNHTINTEKNKPCY